MENTTNIVELPENVSAELAFQEALIANADARLEPRNRAERRAREKQDRHYLNTKKQTISDAVEIAKRLAHMRLMQRIREKKEEWKNEKIN